MQVLAVISHSFEIVSVPLQIGPTSKLHSGSSFAHTALHTLVCTMVCTHWFTHWFAQSHWFAHTAMWFSLFTVSSATPCDYNALLSLTMGIQCVSLLAHLSIPCVINNTVCSNCRPERWIVTIPSSDQWLTTIGNHWKTIVSNGWRTIKPLKNHCYQWFLDPKTIGKPLLPMVLVTKNH